MIRFILLAAGNGERLWPMSTDERPKQFLPLFPHPKNSSSPVSMLQRLVAQLSDLGYHDQISIVTTQAHSDLVHAQVGPIPLHLIPYRKESFASVAWGALDAAKKFNMKDDDRLIFLPVDHFVSETFFQRIKDLSYNLISKPLAIGLLGIKPTEPLTSYGYIQIGTNHGLGISRAHLFIEKPNEMIARTLLKNSLWNAGIFALQINACYRIFPFFHALYPSASAHAMNVWFDALSAESFDREILENYPEMYVAKFEGEWEDVGTWDRATKHMCTTTMGPSYLFASQNVHVINDLLQPVIVAGLHDVAVIATARGIVITKKTLAPQLKAFRREVIL